MHDSIRELGRLRRLQILYPIFLVLGILLAFIGAVISLRVDDIFVIDVHLILIVSGLLIIILVNIVNFTEDFFAEKYDMTHLLDIDDKEERFEAYIQHLSEWIASDMEQVNPIRTRGEDPSGPDWGKTDFALGKEPERRDAIAEGEKYEGMEDDLTKTEKLVEQANKDYADYAQKRWEKSESEDKDLIEYGVDRLGDLVRTDYFEKNAEEGAFEKVAKSNDESQ